MKKSRPGLRGGFFFWPRDGVEGGRPETCKARGLLDRLLQNVHELMEQVKQGEESKASR